ADRLEIAERGVMGRQQRVSAVAYHHAGGGVGKGGAAPASLAGGLVHDDTGAAPGQAHGGGEPGQSGTDDVDRARHQSASRRDRIGMRSDFFSTLRMSLSENRFPLFRNM